MSDAHGAPGGLMRMAPEALSPVGGDSSADARTLPGAREPLRVDLCVIGGGSGGLSVAAAAAQLGVSVALVERGAMGGDCLNTGCVPSKALLAAAKRAHEIRTSARFGIVPADPQIDFRAVQAHVQGVISAIAPNDSVERFEGLGVKVVQSHAQFAGKSLVMAGDLPIKARRYVIATGSAPAMPPIPGLESVPFHTNETIFRLTERPSHLVIIGGGPIGVEMAQAFARLGTRVTLIEALKVLGKEDPEVSDIVLGALRAEGVDIREGANVDRISGGTRLIDVHITHNGQSEIVQGSDLLVATGRVPNVAGLNLEAAGIVYDRRGIKVNRGLVTSNRRVFAIGDVIGDAQFTHIANYHAGIVIRRSLFRAPARINPDIYPWVTFTDPEIAHVGLNEDVARKRHSKVHVYRWPMSENDRAQAERTTAGFVKVVTNASGKILGASVVGTAAGELIQMWSLAVSQGLHLKAMTQWISPYPTLSEVNRRAAFGYYAAAATNPMVRKLIGWLAKLG